LIIVFKRTNLITKVFERVIDNYFHLVIYNNYNLHTYYNYNRVNKSIVKHGFYVDYDSQLDI